MPIEGSEFEVSTTSIIAAISQEPGFENIEELREGKDWVKTDKTGQMILGGKPVEGVYAGGDVLDLGLVTIAIANGRLAAKTIHERFRGIEPEEGEKPPVIKADKLMLDYCAESLSHKNKAVPVEERFKDGDMEITSTLSKDDMIAEARRCMSCSMCFDCGTCWSYCQDSAIVKSPEGKYTFKLELCKGCDKCAENCPCGYIEMK